jgi:hypothetical protein
MSGGARTISARGVAGGCFVLAVAVVSAGADEARAINLALTRSDLERAVALARWPHSDADRARFHQRYIVRVDAAAIENWTVEHIEVITEFRRVELMAEEHARLNDSWGRAGVKDVEDAIGPWRGVISIVAHLGLRTNLLYVGHVPPVDVALGGPNRVAPTDTRRSDLYANCGDLAGCLLTGGRVEAVFDAKAIGQSTRRVSVLWKGDELARVSIDFADLE